VGTTSVVSVLFRTFDLDLDWVPPEAPVVLVHNDRSFPPDRLPRPATRHIHSPENIGFGRAVNLAVDLVSTERVLICNPDTALGPEHWTALMADDAAEVRAVPLVDAGGVATSVVNPYPSPLGHLLAGFRVGRLAPRGGFARSLAGRLGRGWVGENARSLAITEGRWPMSTHWVSGAVFSVDRARFRAVGGFSDDYFLYFEDVDLCRRLGTAFPDTAIVMSPVPPAVHEVGQSSRDRGNVTEVHRARSAARYARTQAPLAWRPVALALGARAWWLDRRARR
jgi:GT2 family glycosyltransferase